MPVIKCGGGSSGLSETVLWEGNYTSIRNDTRIALSQEVSDFTYVKIIFKKNSNSVTDEVIFTTSTNTKTYIIGGDLSDNTYHPDYFTRGIKFEAKNSTESAKCVIYGYCLNVYYDRNEHKVICNTNVTAYAEYAIPIKIIGLK